MNDRILHILFWFLPATGCFAQIETQPVKIETTQPVYQTDDTLSVTITGIIRTTGGCYASPMFGIAQYKDLVWQTIIDPAQPQMDCGLPSMSCNNSTLALLMLSNPHYDLGEGVYKILIISAKGELIESNAFQIIDK